MLLQQTSKNLPLKLYSNKILLSQEEQLMLKFEQNLEGPSP